MVRETLSIRSYARADKERRSMAMRNNANPCSSGTAYLLSIRPLICALQKTPFAFSFANRRDWISRALITLSRIWALLSAGFYRPSYRTVRYDLHLYIHPIKQRTRDPVQVGVNRPWRADALTGGVIVIAARAWIHGGDQHEARGVLHGVSRPRDGNLLSSRGCRITSRTFRLNSGNSSRKSTRCAQGLSPPVEARCHPLPLPRY